MEQRKSRLQQAPAIVIALVALFAAISGTALALPGSETVNSGDIKNESVKSIDLKDGKAVSGDDVVDESLTGTDVQDSSLQGNEIVDGSLTSDDVADQNLTAQDLAANSVNESELAPSSIGAQELGDAIKPRFASANVPGGTAHNGNYNESTATASCLAGEELISGGGFFNADDESADETVIAEVTPNHAGESVTVRGGNDSGDDATLIAYAECI